MKEAIMKPTLIEKPWGGEELFEKNDKYMFKRLTMRAGHRCSLQYHEKKRETIYVLSGRLKLVLGKDEAREEVIMGPDEVMTIEPHTVHRMEAVEDAVYLEASTPELEDVVRLQDDYQRTKR